LAYIFTSKTGEKINLLTHWGEFVSMIALLVGFAIAVGIQNEISLYVVIFLAGIIAGRLCWEEEVIQPMSPIYLIIIGFLIGYVLGLFLGSRILVIIVFFIGGIGSYYAHKKGLINL